MLFHKLAFLFFKNLKFTQVVPLLKYVYVSLKDSCLGTVLIESEIKKSIHVGNATRNFV